MLELLDEEEEDDDDDEEEEDDEPDDCELEECAELEDPALEV